MQVVATIPNMGVGPGAISIDATGLAYISGFFSGTLVWNTKTRAFVRGAGQPGVRQARRMAVAAARSRPRRISAGDVYQAFFGSPSQNLPPYVFVFKSGTFTLSDSISVGTGPSRSHSTSEFRSTHIHVHDIPHQTADLANAPFG